MQAFSSCSVSRSTSLVCRLLSLILFLYIPHLWTWQLIEASYFKQHEYGNNFRFPFSSLFFSLVVSALQDAKSYAFPAKRTELHLGCHTCWLRYFTLVACDADGRGRTVTWLPKVLVWLDYQIFLGMGLHSRVRGSARKEKYCDRFCIELQLH